ncbi:MAG TPA: glycosyltransferase family 4 protein [Candidatus Saccharimonadales bacterium]|nr:glycosyltransferase family 4 protein [Candidatus Saccharimonadales bacterium]
MKILHVISMGYICGGAEKSVIMLRDGLLDRGHEVKIMSSDRDADVPHFSDYECRHISGPLGLIRHLWSGSAYRTLKRAIREFKPDVVHFHTMGELSPSVLFALGGTPALLTVHGPEEYTETMLEWYLPPTAFNGDVSRKNLTPIGRLHFTFFKYVQRPLYKLGFGRLRLMVSPSKYLAQKLALEGFDVPVGHVYNGIALPNEQPLPAEPNLLYVGRLEHVKGVDVLLRALPGIVTAVPGAHLRIVGDGPERARLEQLAEELGVTNAVTFCGWLKGDAVLAEYAKAKLHIIPSVWPENLPTVAIEALAVGRPIVGSRVGGIPELIEDGVTGEIVTPGDHQELATAITGLLTDKQLAAKATAARVSADRFALSTFITNIEKIYGDLQA